MGQRFTISQKETEALADALEAFAQKNQNDPHIDEYVSLGDRLSDVAMRGTGTSFSYEMHVDDQFGLMMGEILDHLFDDGHDVVAKFPILKPVADKWNRYTLGETKQMKKSKFRTIAEAMALGKLPALPTPSLKYRRIAKGELSNLVKEEFKEAKDVAKVKADEGDWATQEIANEVNWMKGLKIKEAFKK